MSPDCAGCHPATEVLDWRWRGFLRGKTIVAVGSFCSITYRVRNLSLLPVAVVVAAAVGVAVVDVEAHCTASDCQRTVRRCLPDRRNQAYFSILLERTRAVCCTGAHRRKGVGTPCPDCDDTDRLHCFLARVVVVRFCASNCPVRGQKYGVIGVARTLQFEPLAEVFRFSGRQSQAQPCTTLKGVFLRQAASVKGGCFCMAVPG